MAKRRRARTPSADPRPRPRRDPLLRGGLIGIAAIALATAALVAAASLIALVVSLLY